MTELLHEAILPANILYTIMAGLSVLYMFSVILGAFDIDALDLDFNLDVDVDMDADLDMDADSDGGFFISALSFFNLGKIPFMVFFSVLSISMWAMAVMANHYMGGGSVIFALMTFIPILFLGLLITKAITTPLVPIYKSMNEGAAEIDYVGREGRLLFSIDKDSKGQADIVIDGDPHRLTVALPPDAEVNEVPKGSRVVITSRGDGSYYHVLPAHN